jgi:hypothetical protein
MRKGFALASVLFADGTLRFLWDHDTTHPNPQDDLDNLIASGATVVRFDISLFDHPQWDETTRGRYKEIVSHLTDAGIATIGLLGHGIVPAPHNRQADWNARPAPHNPNGDNPFIVTYAQIAATLAAEFTQITHWELWNEPNGTGEHATFMDHDLYAALLRRTYQAIKAERPDSTIITGGLLGQNNFDPHKQVTSANSGAAYLQQVYQDLPAPTPDAPTPFDAIGLHLYVDQGFPHAAPDLPAYFARVEQDLAANLGLICGTISTQEPHNAARPIFITEAAWPVDPAVPDQAMAQEIQAHNLRTLYTLCQRTPQIADVCWFKLRDDEERLFGVLENAAWTPKPAFRAYRELSLQ